MNPALIIGSIQLMQLLAQARIQQQQLAAAADAAARQKLEQDLQATWAQAAAIHEKLQGTP